MNRVRTQKALEIRIVRRLLSWFSANARDLPWRRTTDPYAIWVSEIMLQQTQVKTVIPYWERWMHALPDIKTLANAPAGKIHKLWEGLGYYTRVRNLQKAAQTIVASHAGRFPTEFEQVLSLPGIGRYTAGAICSIAYNQPTPILDGNVIRVLTRLFGIRENPREKNTNTRLWQLAQSLVSTAHSLSPNHNPNHNPNLSPSSLNQSLMELGALVCTPRQPKCDECPVRQPCVARRKNLIEKLPNLDKCPSQTRRTLFTFIILHKGKFLVQQRPTGVVNAHLWEFPSIEPADKQSDPAASFLSLFAPGHNPDPAPQVLPYCEIRHSITRYRIVQKVFRIELAKGPIPQLAGGKWRTLSELNPLPFTSAHGKIRKELSDHTQSG